MTVPAAPWYRPSRRRNGIRAAGETAIYACICFGINERTLREHVRAGARTLDALAEACGAGSDCACCRDRLLRLIAEETERPDPDGRR